MDLISSIWILGSEGAKHLAFGRTVWAIDVAIVANDEEVDTNSAEETG